jgi:hypothetical protein
MPLSFNLRLEIPVPKRRSNTLARWKLTATADVGIHS